MNARSLDTPAADAARGGLADPAVRRPRLGFLGLGWIGRSRLEAVVGDGHADVVAVSDPSPDAAEQARRLAPGAETVESLDALLDLELDGVVIATPSALHAAHSMQALERGVSVFCQKPLARTAEETRRVVRAARAADRLLHVDLSYRHAAAMRRVRELVQQQALGIVYAADLVFHNAYGPDKSWFRDRALSGGGCVIDLGIHLVDLALWTLGFPRVERVESHLYTNGQRLEPQPVVVEDYAIAQIMLHGGAVLRLACSWNLPAGRDAVIEAVFHGTSGGAGFRNVNGSFYDFVAEQYDGTRTTLLVEPPDAWGGRAAVQWARRLAASARFDPEAERLVEVAAALDAIYGR